MAIGILTFSVLFTLAFGGVPASFDFVTQYPMKQSCLKNSGSSTTYKQIILALDEVGACFSRNSMLINNLNDTTTLGCPRWEQDRACLNPIIDPVLSCLTGSRKQNRVFLDKLANGIIQLKCTIDQMKEYNETDKEDLKSSNHCMRNKGQSVMDCDAPFFGKSIILSDYSARDCAQLSRSKICVRDVLQTCRVGKILHDVFEMIYNVAYDVNQCSEDIGSESIENEI